MEAYEPWDTAMAIRWQESEGSDYVGLGIGAAGAGSAVALGGFFTALEVAYADKKPPVERRVADAAEKLRQSAADARDSGGADDAIVKFVASLARPNTVEACYRVVTWGYIADWASFIAYGDPAGYDRHVEACESVFGTDSPHEAAMRDAGRPFVGALGDVEREAQRDVALAEASLARMVATALGAADRISVIEVAAYLDAWVSQWQEGRSALGQRVDVVAPGGVAAP